MDVKHKTAIARQCETINKKIENFEYILDITKVCIYPAYIDCDGVDIAILGVCIVLDIERRRRVDIVRCMALMAARRKREAFMI